MAGDSPRVAAGGCAGVIGVMGEPAGIVGVWWCWSAAAISPEMRRVRWSSDTDGPTEDMSTRTTKPGEEGEGRGEGRVERGTEDRGREEREGE